MELAGLEPATSWVRCAAIRGDYSRFRHSWRQVPERGLASRVCGAERSCAAPSTYACIRELPRIPIEQVKSFSLRMGAIRRGRAWP
jgi:hypothetical protein